MLEFDDRSRRGVDDGAEMVSVGVIGAGRLMTPLLSRMLEYDYVDVRIVIDPNPLAPGMMIAESLGVPTSGEVEDIFPLMHDLDFVFCVFDDPSVRDSIYDHMRSQNNRRTMLFNELATRFIMSLTKDARELMQLVPSYPVHRVADGD
jgi:acetaldehyde dehydrogenase (acetylating)